MIKINIYYLINIKIKTIHKLYMYIYNNIFVKHFLSIPIYSNNIKSFIILLLYILMKSIDNICK